MGSLRNGILGGGEREGGAGWLVTNRGAREGEGVVSRRDEQDGVWRR